MKYDTYGNPIFQENDIFNLLYKNITTLDNISAENSEDILKFIQNTDYNINIINDESLSVQDFDKIHQNDWFIPDKYKSFNIYDYCLTHCCSDDESIRCFEELILYEKFNLIPVLQLLKYIVDTLHENKIILGVGRGSSVASYVLYKLGVHKIDSLKYNLDYTEFLRE
jgi:hypothetical protein